jgi:glycerophosphoryl diester phosphodiesterase
LASYHLAIEQCADFIELDLVSTKGGVLVARHENFIRDTTDVASHPEFASKQTTKTVDGVALTGWFTEDFTLAELKTLRAVERLPLVRPHNTAYDGQFEIPTFQEVIDLVRSSRTCDGQLVGIYLETKHPTYFDSIGLSLAEPLVATLEANGSHGPRAPVFIQSFEVSNLQQLNTMTQVPLVQLLDCTGKPWDFTVNGDPRPYATLATPQGLDFIATYADGIGACKNLLVPRDASDSLATPSAVIGDAHDRSLLVHGWTFRRESQFLPANFRTGSDPNAYGNLEGEITTFLAAGMDGFFTDQPDVGVGAVGATRADR